MTISRERFTDLSNNVAHSMDGFEWSNGCAVVTDSDLTKFALALIRRVEAECGMNTTIDGKQHVIKLALVSEE